MAETPLERGAYLVRGIAACGNCHTTRDSDEKPIAAMKLAGGRALDVPLAIIVMPNITSDKERASVAGPMNKLRSQFAIGDGRMAH